MVVVTGTLACPGCRRHFDSFQPFLQLQVSALDVLRSNRKELKRGAPAAAAASGEGEEEGFKVEALAGIQHFAGSVCYKVIWVVNKRSSNWVAFEESWEPREQMINDGLGALIAEFHKAFMLPTVVPAGLFWAFSYPMVRMDRDTRTTQYKCSVAGCEAVFSVLDAALKHAYSKLHYERDNDIRLPMYGPGIKSPFVCPMCDSVVCFSQKSTLGAHRLNVHTVKNFDFAAWEEYEVEMESDSE